ncbi:cytochrome P450 [Nocardia bovistercoris]|uniref:Cytochrome P450 n=1 Tax=Nocardia bovistercoris TaxID=2785916 RepID=A0A931IDR0_9NOCA|nr:cytochrome P450 [Nocardia bovistercoris]MBH0779306.1 cytochrome P450 [Nocardia bovistercoris]
MSQAGAPAQPTTADELSTELRLMLQIFDPANRHDPFPYYRRLRELGPAHRSPLGLTLLTRYDEVATALTGADWGHDQEVEQLHSGQEEAFPPVFMWMEPPDHTRLRGLVSKAFTPRRIMAMRPRVEQIVAGLLDTALAAGEFDAITGLAYPLPLTVICEILGVPACDHDRVQDWSQVLSRGLDPDHLLPQRDKDARAAATPAFLDYLRDLIAERRAAPTDDLISALAAVEEQGDRLTEEEMLGTIVFLIVAGHETTVNLIGNGLLALVRHPDQLALLRARPELVRPAIEEMLRYDGPPHLNTRSARVRTTLGGQTFEPGDGVVTLLACANRDPRAFDDPEVFDITRFDGHAPVSRHLAFSLGHHYCLGAPLATMEMEVLLQAVLARVGSIELLQDEPPYRPNVLIRGLAELRLRFRG